MYTDVYTYKYEEYISIYINNMDVEILPELQFYFNAHEPFPLFVISIYANNSFTNMSRKIECEQAIYPA